MKLSYFEKLKRVELATGVFIGGCLLIAFSISSFSKSKVTHFPCPIEKGCQKNRTDFKRTSPEDLGYESFSGSEGSKLVAIIDGEINDSPMSNHKHILIVSNAVDSVLYYGIDEKIVLKWQGKQISKGQMIATFSEGVVIGLKVFSNGELKRVGSICEECRK